MKSKVFLVYFTRLFGLLKFVQFSTYLKTVLRVIVDDDCESDCVVEWSEAVFIAVLFLPVCLLMYGVVRVKLFTQR
jgi:hypothetical protein